MTDIYFYRFLQARFHLDSLVAKTTLRKLRVALDTLPDGLDETYDEVMRRISVQGNDKYQLARKVLSWIVNAMTPLSPLMLRQALAIEDQDTSFDEENMPDEDLLVSVCQGLISVHKDTGFVGFAHFTTQEYFISKRFSLFPEAQKEVLRACLTFLSFHEFENEMYINWKDFQQRVREYPFLAYAGKYIFHDTSV